VCTLAAFVSGCEDVQALREALRQSLPAAAVPDRWQVLERLPRNANNKIDRHALRSLLVGTPTNAAAGSDTERIVMQAWRDVLGDRPLTPASNFFELGGKSLQAIQVSSRLAQALQRDVAVSLLFRHATVQALARALEAPAAHRPPAVQDPFAPLLTLQQAGTGAPVLWCLHPAEGLAWGDLRLAPHLPRVTLQGLQMDPAQALAANDFDGLVDALLRRLQAQQRHGPYHLLGWSLGGGLAQALAVRLAACGETVALLALMDSYPAEAWVSHPAPTLEDVLRTLLGVNGDFDTAGLEASALRLRLLRPGSPFAGLGEDGLERWSRAALYQMQLFRRGRTPGFAGPMVFYRALRNPPGAPPLQAWHAHVPAQGMACVELDCTHDGMSDPQPMACIGADLVRQIGGAA
jgi:thioesterase domain-containing protein